MVCFGCVHLHYSEELASFGHSQVPFKALMDDPRPFVDLKYVPCLNIFRDPHNMPKEDLIWLLEHIHNWQITFGAEDAFRFSHYQKQDKKFEEACYPTETVTNVAQDRRPKAGRKKRR